MSEKPIRGSAEQFSDYIEQLIKNPAVTTLQDGINLEPSSGYEYVIPWQECRDYSLILGWIEHLSRKRWCTPRLIVAFFCAACEHHGLSINRALM